MTYEVKESRSEKRILLKDDNKEIREGDRIEFRMGSDCPTGEYLCKNIEDDGMISFERYESESPIIYFEAHIEEIIDEISREYIKV